MKEYKVNHLSGAIGMIVSAWFFVGAMRLPERSSSLYIKALCGVFFLFSAILIIQSFLKKREEPISWVKSPTHFSAAIAMIVIYVFSIKFLGFFPASALFMFALAWFFDFRRKYVLGIVTIALLTFIYYIFAVFLEIPIPYGVFEEVFS